MDRKANRNQMLLTIVFIVISLVLVGGSYFVYRSRQQDMLAEQASTFSSVSVNFDTNSSSTVDYDPATLVAAFNENRAETTALSYLFYVQDQEQTPTITFARNQAGQEAWTETIKTRLTEFGLTEPTVNSVDWTGLTTEDIIAQYSGSITDGDPQLIVLPSFVEEDFNAGISAEDHKANLEELYNLVRLDLPSALIVFAAYPPLDQALEENDDYADYRQTSQDGINDLGYNFFDIHTAYASDRDKSEDVTLENSYTEDGFSDDANDLIVNVVTRHIEKATIDATNGYNGENKDVQELQAALDAESESESIAAEEQASLDAESESIAAEEQASLDAEAEAASIAAEEQASIDAENAAIAESESIAAEEAAAAESYYYESSTEVEYSYTPEPESSTTEETIVEEEASSSTSEESVVE
ncbi:SGNH/GDSL hydrolase family protein [Aerococcus agrisoli]|uniref:SGNH/GDSL hydrolase family protein n=1 Tax=Aerococcus agrisoli TaxID=2487350 RepID=A0A3N4G883_9LACT|nr:SGNH/GDSL hydrolase family protein [Aerococcus agrisoli]RPA57607.1 SGNH/GDSL hydrolase family protein [Aerococcus agrisoli]